MIQNRPRFRKHISEAIHDMFCIWMKELQTTFKDHGVMIFFVIVPLVYPLIYAYMYNNETVREVPIVVVDQSHSSLSREYVRLVDASPSVKVVAYAGSRDEAKHIMQERNAYGFFYIPSTFSKDLQRGGSTNVSVFSDMSSLLYYKSIVMSCTDASLKMNANIKVKRSHGFTERQDEVTRHPIKYTDVTMFNPQSGFASFILPAVLMLLIQQTLIFGIGISVGTNREQNKYRSLQSIKRHNNGTLRIVMGKALSYFMLYIIVSIYILVIVPHIFSLVQMAKPDVLGMFIVPYLASCIFFSMTVTGVVRNRETCMLLFVFASVPLLFLSGVCWPASAMPAFWKYFSYLFPSTFGINGYIVINSMGGTLYDVAFESRALWIQAGIYFITTCLVYRKHILRSRMAAIKEWKDEKKSKQEVVAK